MFHADIYSLVWMVGILCVQGAFSALNFIFSLNGLHVFYELNGCWFVECMLTWMATTAVNYCSLLACLIVGWMGVAGLNGW